jgi:hypothetical protein
VSEPVRVHLAQTAAVGAAADDHRHPAGRQPRCGACTRTNTVRSSAPPGRPRRRCAAIAAPTSAATAAVRPDCPCPRPRSPRAASRCRQAGAERPRPANPVGAAATLRNHARRSVCADHRRRAVCTADQAQPLRQVRQPPARDRRHGIRQRAGRLPGQVQPAADDLLPHTSGVDIGGVPLSSAGLHEPVELGVRPSLVRSPSRRS